MGMGGVAGALAAAEDFASGALELAGAVPMWLCCSCAVHSKRLHMQQACVS
jgi:hypothetical protein